MSDTVSIAGGNLFMRCDTVNQNAFREPPAGIHFRSCRPGELELWKRLSVEDPTYVSFMTEYFEKVYASQAEEFFRRCTFACTQDDTPIGTCFLWKAYGQVTTLHWYRVLPAYEGQGIGRALLTYLFQTLTPEDYPLYLHTHPACTRALHLYSDFGFALVREPAVIGTRSNHWQEALSYLEKAMPPAYYQQLTARMADADETLLRAAASREHEEF